MQLLIIIALAIVGIESAPESRLSSPLSLLSTETRIVGGEPAQLGEIIYQAQLTLNFIYRCTGIIQSAHWVLTAAHCLENTLIAQIYVGSIQSEDTTTVRTATILSMFKHPQFNRNTLDFDAGLIKLTPKLNFNFFIGPAKLPATSEFIDYTNDLVIISGWGATSDTSGVSTVLNTVKMHVYANNLCADYYGSDIITEHKICAKANNEETKSTCGGDSGGPMYHNSSETVIGITSFGSIEGCEMGAPVGFTLIRSVINWINLVTN